MVIIDLKEIFQFSRFANIILNLFSTNVSTFQFLIQNVEVYLVDGTNNASIVWSVPIETVVYTNNMK